MMITTPPACESLGCCKNESPGLCWEERRPEVLVIRSAPFTIWWLWFQESPLCAAVVGAFAFRQDRNDLFPRFLATQRAFLGVPMPCMIQLPALIMIPWPSEYNYVASQRRYLWHTSAEIEPADREGCKDREMITNATIYQLMQRHHLHYLRIFALIMLIIPLIWPWCQKTACGRPTPTSTDKI